MGPKGKHPATRDLFQQPLAELINLKHPLVKLAGLIDWSVFESRWAEFFPSKRPVRCRRQSPPDPASPPAFLRLHRGQESVALSKTQIRSPRHGFKWVIQDGLFIKPDDKGIEKNGFTCAMLVASI